ncbi:MAG: 6,7-dimethyl-8-ribityllumazine synthase [Zetaproteobacteria bacterium]|nr:MAG: 6,7-dimethyl-8-ribityllumazine synthase [Zetaproteobacteria bacterium]
MSRWREVAPPRLDASALRVGIVAARFNRPIVDALLRGALDALRAMDACEDQCTIVRVPGALEIPTVAAAMADRGWDAIVCLGCVIRGDTDHYLHVCRVAMDGVGRIAARGTVGVGNGILTVNDEAEAWARAGGVHGNKGAEAAQAAVEVALALRALGGAR